ncbi:MAG: HD domain-containing protein [Anaerolineaceae bacterium]|nr:HD domain-containing protein [Anaerolineaceae bacterium]
MSETTQKIPQTRTLLPIRYKIILPYLILSLVIAVSGALLLSRIVFDSLEGRFINQLIEVGKLAQEWMVNEEEELLSTFRLIANTQGVGEAIQARDPETLRAITYGLAVENRTEYVHFIDASGAHVFSMAHLPDGKVEEYQFSKFSNIEFAQWSFTAQVLNQETDAQGDKFAGWRRYDDENCFFIAGPVFNANDEFSGVLLIGETIKSMAKQAREDTLAQISFYDLKGNQLATTFFQESNVDPAIIEQVIGTQDEFSIRLNETNQNRSLVISGIDYEEMLAPWEIRGGKDIGVIGTSLPKTFLVVMSSSTKWQAVFFVTLTIVLVAIVGAVLSRIITKPINDLMYAAQEAADGHLTEVEPPNSKDELAVLAKTFNHMITQIDASNQEMVKAYTDTLHGWGKALDLRDSNTEGHTMRVAQMTVQFASRIGITGNDLNAIYRGALLHDIGKIGIPDSILQKPGPLTDEEWAVMKMHPAYGRDMITSIEYLASAIDIPYHHHEQWDGNGYPLGLKEDEIPLAARLFSIVDVWDALCSDRPYRDGMSFEQVSALMRAGQGTKFDPVLLDKFMEMIDEHPNLYEQYQFESAAEMKLETREE